MLVAVVSDKQTAVHHVNMFLSSSACHSVFLRSDGTPKLTIHVLHAAIIAVYKLDLG